MGHRSKNAVRCTGCHQNVELCLCSQLKKVETETHLALVMHQRERKKSTSTGPLALAVLQNSELFIHGERGAPLALHHLATSGRRLLVLFPSEDARPLSQELLAEDPRPVTLIVVDGNWRQASRAARRIPGLENAEKVTLAAGGRTEWGLRRETKPGGLATFEAIARSFGVLEGPALQQQMEALFREMVRRQRSRMPYLEERDGVREQAPASPASSEPLRIVYEDEDLVVVNKPSGMLVHRGWAEDGVPALQLLRDQLGQHLFPVHRLDRSTSGALLFAKRSEVARDMQALFQDQQVKKTYLALCRGKDPELSLVDHPLSKEPGRGERRPAQTRFRFLGHSGRYGLYEVEPKTGRSHQIRRHLKHVSQPIIGDVRYGKGEHNRHFRETFDFHRLALHCLGLSFAHPRTGELVEVNAELPADFLALLLALGLPVPHPVTQPASQPEAPASAGGAGTEREQGLEQGAEHPAQRQCGARAE